MVELKRTDASNPEFISLVHQLDAYLAVTDGSEHGFYDQYNQLDEIRHVILGISDGQAIACGAMRLKDQHTVEIKRMYTSANHRRQGIAQQILNALETWAKELGYRRCILETGLRQNEAVKFYYQAGYQRIANYAPYEGMANSICFAKNVQ